MLQLEFYCQSWVAGNVFHFEIYIAAMQLLGVTILDTFTGPITDIYLINLQQMESIIWYCVIVSWNIHDKSHSLLLSGWWEQATCFVLSYSLVATQWTIAPSFREYAQIGGAVYKFHVPIGCRGNRIHSFIQHAVVLSWLYRPVVIYNGGYPWLDWSAH